MRSIFRSHMKVMKIGAKHIERIFYDNYAHTYELKIDIMSEPLSVKLKTVFYEPYPHSSSLTF